ncbi:MAG: alpha/beta hydrolase [Alphaproteobacteria bacterium]|nr:alpha/beta hydrolase [Alphaproteobacteria bacterium]
MKVRGIFLLAMACLLAGCLKLSFAAANLPALFSNTKTAKDIFYGSAPLQKLDIYTPKTDGPPRDVIVFLYGGRWETGNREDYRFVGETFVDRGFVVVIPDYRKFPSVRFPVFVEDAAQSLAWVHDNIARYGGNPARIHILGHSAGAHIGSLLVADRHYLKALGKDADTVVKSFAGLAGPYSFTPDEPDLQAIFAPPENYAAMQADTFINGREAPMLLLYGSADTLVKRSNLDKMVAAINAKGGHVETKIYDGVDHMWIVGALTWLGHNKPDVAADVARFFGSVR